jgi:hypothetical protein
MQVVGFLVLVGVVALSGEVRPQARGVQPVIQNPDGSLTGQFDEGLINLGTYHALLIGINNYANHPKLRTAVKDVETLRDILIRSYGFARENVRLVTEGDATRAGIIETFTTYRDRPLGESDNLLIYYAGHGFRHSRTEDGFWIPVDGTDQEASWISVDEIRRIVRRIEAKHTLLISDSCFSGSLTRQTVELQKDRFLAEIARKDSYQVITSGGLEPVADRGREGNSLFAYFVKSYLEDSNRPYITADRLFTEIQPLVSNAAESRQTPERGKISGAFDQGGQFVFARVGLDAIGAPAMEARPLTGPEGGAGVVDKSPGPVGTDPSSLRRVYVDPRAPNIEFRMSKSQLVRLDLKRGVLTDLTDHLFVGSTLPIEERPYRYADPPTFSSSPSNVSVIYLGSQYVHRSKDGGLNWETISPDLAAWITEYPHEDATITAIVESPHDPETIWTGSGDGAVHVTRDGGKNWKEVTPDPEYYGRKGSLSEPAKCTEIRVTGKNAESVVVHFERAGTVRIYETLDHGDSWKLTNDR